MTETQRLPESTRDRDLRVLVLREAGGSHPAARGQGRQRDSLRRMRVFFRAPDPEGAHCTPAFPGILYPQRPTLARSLCVRVRPP